MQTVNRHAELHQFGIPYIEKIIVMGPVVQSIVSLTSSLRGQLVKCFTTFIPNTLIIFVNKLQKLLTFFSTKNIGVFEIFKSEILTKR